MKYNLFYPFFQHKYFVDLILPYCSLTHVYHPMQEFHQFAYRSMFPNWLTNNIVAIFRAPKAKTKNKQKTKCSIWKQFDYMILTPFHCKWSYLKLKSIYIWYTENNVYKKIQIKFT